MSDNTAIRILQDKVGNLWFDTLNGLNRMQLSGGGNNRSTSLFKKYLFLDGLFGMGGRGIHNNNFYQDSKGNIWVSSRDRLICFNPELDIADSIPPNKQLK